MGKILPNNINYLFFQNKSGLFQKQYDSTNPVLASVYAAFMFLLQ
jgi:hypothetical protein